MASAIPLSRHRLSVDQFHEMARTGILPSDARVELIDGELIDMAPMGSRHSSIVARLSMRFAQDARDTLVYTQNAISLPPSSEPQPDIAVLAPSPDNYRGALPRARDVLLVIEVADTTLRYDQGIKADLYARHGIAELWVVNLPDDLVEVCRDPAGGQYRTRIEMGPPEVVVPVALPWIGVDLGWLFRT